MKNILLSLLFVLVWNIKAQQIEPLENLMNYQGEITAGTYFKDVNHLLDKYIGIWTGTYNGITVEFHVTKTTEVIISGITYSKDVLIIRYKVTDSSGVILADTTNTPNDNIYLISGLWITSNHLYYQLNYSGYSLEKCSPLGVLSIKTVNNDLQMKVRLLVDYVEEQDPLSGGCSGEEEKIFPETGEPMMTLDKQ